MSDADGRRAGAALAGAVLVALTACAAPEAPRGERLRLSVGAYLTESVAFVGHELGIFAAHGLDVELVRVNNSNVALMTLLGGDIDAAGSGPLNARSFNVVARGAEVRLVAARSHYDPEGCAHDAFVVRTALLDAGRVVGPASLRGLRLTTERTGSNYYYFTRLLELGGLGMGDVEIVDLPVASRGEGLARGWIDVATASEPWATRLTRGGPATLWKRVADVLPNYQSSYLVFGGRLTGERRDLGRRFLAAYLEAARRLREEGKSPRHVEAIARWTKLDAEELRAMCWPAIPADPHPDPRTLADYQAWAFAEGLLDAVTPYEQLVDTGFLDELAGAAEAAR